MILHDFTWFACLVAHFPCKRRGKPTAKHRLCAVAGPCGSCLYRAAGRGAGLGSRPGGYGRDLMGIYLIMLAA